MTPDQEKFIQSVKRQAAANDITVVFEDKQYFQDVKNGVKYVGYFDSDNRTLAVATKKPFTQWFSVFVHEVCHMDQYLENDPDWDIQLQGKFQSYVPLDIYEMYVDGVISLSKEQKAEILGKTIQVELNCEHRAVQKIIDHNLKINVPRYCQAANLCLYDYVYAFQNRLWYDTKRIRKREILNVLPKTLFPKVEDYFRIPSEVKEQFDRILKT